MSDIPSQRTVWRRPAACAAAALALSLLLFAPRLWLLRTYRPGTFEWDRAHSYLRQCEDPFRRDLEPAMRWRLLPPLVCHTLGLRGLPALAVPWLGVLAATGYVVLLLRRRLDDPRFLFGGALLFATTSAVIVATTWLGMNDAWVWLGLLVVAFGRAPVAIAAAALLGPWIDERFLFGFPLAWLVRCLDRNEPVFSRATLQALWLLPYVALRAASGGDAAATAFLRASMGEAAARAPLAPLGWWMALRAGWVPVAYGLWCLSPRPRMLAGALIAALLIVSVCLASDLSRSAAIIVPFMLWGCFVYARRNPAAAPRALLVLGLANLAIPAAHVVLNKVDVINPLVVEVARLWRIP